MGFKRVDSISNEPLEGFSYLNQNGHEEAVRMEKGSPLAKITYAKADLNSTYFNVYYKDIPNLVKALTAAYEQEMGEKI